MIAKPILYFHEKFILICDAKCSKAFGINSRPSNQLSEEEDDYEWLADDELPEAPEDPQTYEGGQAKPTHREERLNKWCARECERSKMVKCNEDFSLFDFSIRVPNYGSRRKGVFDD